MAQEIIAAATGRRKTAVARVSLVSGEGKCTINRKSAEEYVTDYRLGETDYPNIFCSTSSNGNACGI